MNRFRNFCIKIASVNSYCEIIDSNSEETPLIFTEEGGIEQDPEIWWNRIKKGILRLKKNNSSTIWKSKKLFQ